VRSTAQAPLRQRVAYRLVEVEDGIELAAGADPGVDDLACYLAVPGEVVVRVVATEGGQRRGIGGDGGRVRLGGDLLVRRAQLAHDLPLRRLCGIRRADVVRPGEDHQPPDAAGREHVTVQARDDARAETVAEHPVPANAQVQQGGAASVTAGPHQVV